MRRYLLAVFAAAALLAAGCDRGQDSADEPRVRTSTVIEPETRVDTVPQEEPTVGRTQWRAANDRTRSSAGNLRVSREGSRGGPVIFAFANGVTVRAQPYDVVPANSNSGAGGQSLAAVLGGDPRVDAWLYRVLDENVAASASGGLCGEATTRHLAVSEFVDGSGRWVFKVAAFRGEAGPSSGANPELCGAFAYTSQ